jgi:hypothetical protein
MDGLLHLQACDDPAPLFRVVSSKRYSAAVDISKRSKRSRSGADGDWGGPHASVIGGRRAGVRVTPLSRAHLFAWEVRRSSARSEDCKGEPVRRRHIDQHLGLARLLHTEIARSAPLSIADIRPAPFATASPLCCQKRARARRFRDRQYRDFGQAWSVASQCTLSA